MRVMACRWRTYGGQYTAAQGMLVKYHQLPDVRSVIRAISIEVANSLERLGPQRITSRVTALRDKRR